MRFIYNSSIQGYDLDWQNLAYNDVRVMAGLWLVPDGQNLLEGRASIVCSPGLRIPVFPRIRR